MVAANRQQSNTSDKTAPPVPVAATASPSGITAARRSAAIRLLDEGLVGRNETLFSAQLRRRLVQLQASWDLACDALEMDKDYISMPRTEAPQVVEWCVLLALELIDADLAEVRGERRPRTRHADLWGRLRNLRMGLSSDGSVRTRPFH